jgi:predicted transcriptional regulator of viral defense system
VGQRGIARTRELRAAGVTAATLSRMERDGDLVRLSRGLYQLPDAPIDTHHTLAETAKRVPRGVICLVSALAFHGLTDQLPRKVWIAIGHKDWAPTSVPALHIVRMTDALLRDGAETHTISGVRVKIFSVTRTIIDCFRHRRSVGLNVALEGLQEALRQRKTTPAAIASSAAKSGIAGVIQPYLQALTANA